MNGADRSEIPLLHQMLRGQTFKELPRRSSLTQPTVKPPVATTSRKRPPSSTTSFPTLIPKVSQSKPYIFNLLQATTSRKRPRPLLELKV